MQTRLKPATFFTMKNAIEHHYDTMTMTLWSPLRYYDYGSILPTMILSLWHYGTHYDAIPMTLWRPPMTYAL